MVEESEEENNQPERDSGTTERGDDATTNQFERGGGQVNGGATREGWRNRVAEGALIREESKHGLGGIYCMILVYHNIQVPT